MEKKAIIGHGMVAKTSLPNTDKTIIIMEGQVDESFELNGTRYTRIKTENPKRRLGKTVSHLITMGMFMYAPYMNFMNGEKSYDRDLPEGTDIIKEFGLIQQKKSKLTRWERDKVVRIFNQHFRIDDPPTPDKPTP